MVADAAARAAVVPVAVAAPVAVASGSFFSSCIFFWFMPACYASWWALFTSISPYLFASVGTALAIGLSVLGAAWGIFITGVSLLGAAIKHPRIQSKNLISVIFCEAVAIYGVIMAIIMQSRIVEAEDGGLPSAYLGYALFAAGLTVGFSNLFCGYVSSRLRILFCPWLPLWGQLSTYLAGLATRVGGRALIPRRWRGSMTLLRTCVVPWWLSLLMASAQHELGQLTNDGGSFYYRGPDARRRTTRDRRPPPALPLIRAWTCGCSFPPW